ncbi:hypothetical protein [Kaarinaea lacus]
MQEHDQDSDDKALSDLYAELSQEQPSRALDEKILAEAHEAVAADYATSFVPEKTTGTFSGKWTVPVSLAAVIMLSVTLVLMIERERPYSITSLPEQPRVERKASEPNVIEPAGKREQAKPIVVEPQRDDFGDTSIAQKTPPEAMAERQLQGLAPDPQKKSVDKSQSEERAAAFSASPAPKIEARAKAPPVAEKAKPVQPPSSKTAETPSSQEIAVESPPPVFAKRIGENRVTAPAEDNEQIKPQPTAEAEMDDVAATENAVVAPVFAQPNAQRQAVAPKKDEPVESDRGDLAQDQEKQQENQLSMEVTVSPAFTAPPKTLEQKAAPAPLPTDSGLTALVQTESQDQQCRQMTEQDCLASPLCILEQSTDSESYQCRAAQNSCESGFAQSLHGKEDCEQNPDCQYIPASCYCPPGETCPCAGGSPALCGPKLVND